MPERERDREKEKERENLMQKQIREPLALISAPKKDMATTKCQFGNGTNGVQCGATTKWQSGTRTR